MTAPSANVTTPTCGRSSVDVQPRPSAAEKFFDLLEVARELDKRIEAASAALRAAGSDEQAKVFGRLFGTAATVVDASPESVAGAFEATAGAALGRAVKVLTRLAAEVLAAKAGGVLSPAGLPDGCRFYFRPAWAPPGSESWVAGWLDRMPPDHQALFDRSRLPALDGRAYVAFGPSPGPTVPVARARHLSSQIRSYDDELALRLAE
jgi:hypothetical protein